MLKSALWIVTAFALALLAGPIAFIASHAGEPDPRGLYLVFDFGAQNAWQSDMRIVNARSVGPERGILAGMIEATPDAFHQLLASGYVLLPAGQLATLCGFALTNTSLTTGSL